MRTLCIIAAALLAAVAPLSIAQEPTELLGLRDAYQESIEERTEGLLGLFSVALEKLEKTLASQSKLEEALAVRDQRTALVEAGPNGQPASVELAQSEYLRLAKTYNSQLEGIVGPLRESYVRALATMEKRLAADGLLTAAIAVKKERESLQAPAATAGGTSKPLAGDPEKLAADLIYTVWQVSLQGERKGKARYLFLHEEGKAFFGSAVGTWEAIDGTTISLSEAGGTKAEQRIGINLRAGSLSGLTLKGKLLSRE